MKTVVLDSSPGVPIRIPSDFHFNVTPAFKPRAKGQPILGHNSMKYTHFVPMGEAGHHIKQFLDIEETKTGPTEASAGYGELLQAEKFEKTTGTPVVSTAPVQDKQFEQEAKSNMNLPKKDRIDSFEMPDNVPMIKETNDSSLATVIAASQMSSPPKARRRPRKQPKPKKVKVTRKKMTSFRILKRKK